MKPAKSLKMVTLQEGSGVQAKLGDVVQLRCHCRYSRGEVLFSNEVDAPYQARLGARDAFVGLEQGSLGMRVGGVRQVKVPPNLTYYERNVYPAVSDRSVLHYEIELLQISGEWDSTLHLRASPIYSDSTKELARRYEALTPTVEPDLEFQRLQAQLFEQAEREYREHLAERKSSDHPSDENGPAAGGERLDVRH
ncbi:MAG: FKBP-type peptidyl-prolyl cis-trans isomerase [Verrucomicrobiales bacterium]